MAPKGGPGGGSGTGPKMEPGVEPEMDGFRKPGASIIELPCTRGAFYDKNDPCEKMSRKGAKTGAKMEPKGLLERSWGGLLSFRTVLEEDDF